MKRVVITGGTGFVGANLARRVLREGHETHLLVRRDHTTWRLGPIKSDVHLHDVDLEDAQGLGRVVGAIRPDWVFHLATHGAYSWQTDVQGMVKTNIIGAINLVETCLKTGFEAFVNTGSSSEYGFKKGAPSEDEPLEPNSHYALTKAFATLLCRYAAHHGRVHMPTVRLYAVYGPYEDPRRLIPTLILEGLRGHLPPLVHPQIARDFVYVDDVTEAYLLAATRPSQEPGAIYNLGTGVQTSMREVVEVVQRVMGVAAEPRWGSMPERPWDIDVWVADNGKICRELGWRPVHTFEQGFCSTLNWFRSNPDILRLYRQAAGSDS